MRIEELQQERLPFLRLLSGTWRIYRENLLPFAAYSLIFGGPQFVAQVLLPHPDKSADLASLPRFLAIAISVGLIAGYGLLATSWSVNRVASGGSCDMRSAIRTSIAATPCYLPASIVLIIAGLFILGLLALIIGGTVVAFAATLAAVQRSFPALALVSIVGVLSVSLIAVPVLFAGTALTFYPMIAVLRAVPWTGALSRSWALVRNRWWRVFGMTLVLCLPSLVLALPMPIIPQTIPFRAGLALLPMLLTPFSTVGVTLLFLHLDFLGPVAAPARSDPAPATAEAIP